MAKASTPNSKGWHDASFDFFAILLILVLPFIEFVYTNSFVFEWVTATVVAGCIALALAITVLLARYANRVVRALVLSALLMLFLDVRADIIDALGLLALLVAVGCFVVIWALHMNAGKVLIVMFGVILVFVFSLPVLPRFEDFAAARPPAHDRPGELPTYVHIILDEHMGVEALDDAIAGQRDLKRATKRLFADNGFRLFGRAYSEYFYTRDSLSAAFNAYSGDKPDQFYKRRKASLNRVTQNNYLRDLFAAGYEIRVYQSSFLDYCAAATDIVHECFTYGAFVGISSEALAPLGFTEKLDVVWSALWRRSVVNQTVRRWLRRGAALANGDRDTAEPRRLQRFEGLGPIPTLAVYDRLIADIATAPDATVFFAHLMIPHHVFSVGADCRVRRPVVDWKKFDLPKALPNGQVNSQASRAARYEDYVEQTKCGLIKLEALFAALKAAGKFDDAIIIVHGDHGSRISRLRPRQDFRDRLTDQDYFDGFATLFAAKAPHIDPGYDLRMLSLTELVQHAAETGSVAPPEPERRFVYLHGKSQDAPLVKVPMPPIPGARPAHDGAD